MFSIKAFFKSQTVLVISGVLAALSCFVVPPSQAYLSYINFRVLALLFCLMSVVAGMKDVGAFNVLSRSLLQKVHSLRKLSLLLVLLSFALSMFLTNDVTLVTVVPFTLMVFAELDAEPELLLTLVLETIAANLGSMLTPFGNPQNLYLYAQYEFSMGSFLFLMLPYTLASLLLVTAVTFRIPDRTVAVSRIASGAAWMDVKGFLLYALLFVLSILSVARIVDSRILFVTVTAVIAVFNRRILLRVDYSLLLTFVFFFVFIGNMGNIPAVRAFIEQAMQGRELLMSIIASQFVSNVPAAILLSGFTDNGKALVIGTNLGGLGTLIASMASLITYKFYASARPALTRRYITVFSVLNVVLLLLLYALSLVLHVR